MNTITSTDVARVREAVAAIGDPEYPDVSIVDLGLLESLSLADGVARVGLIPTFSGCPALRMIADDVRRSVETVPDVDRCEVTWLDGPIWSTDRMSASTATALAEEYTVVLRRKDGGLRCPVCGGDAVQDQSMAGPTRCRSVAWCPDCRNPVEVMRASVERSSGMARDDVMRASVERSSGMARDDVMRASVERSSNMARDDVMGASVERSSGTIGEIAAR